MPTLRTRYRDQLRTAILDAARELFVRHGYESFSMRKLARGIGCSHGNLYLYFKNKQQLFDCLVEDSFAQLSSALQHLRDSGHAKSPISLLKEAGRIYVDFGLRNPHAYQFAFIIRGTGPTRPYKPHAAFAFLRNTVRQYIDERQFRALDVDTATQAIWAAVHGVTSLLIARPNFPWVDKEELIKCVIDSAVDTLLLPRGGTDPAVPMELPSSKSVTLAHVPVGRRRANRGTN